VTTTWYDQDDLQKGLPYRTLTSTMNVSDEFNSLDTTKWTFSHPNVRQTLAGVGLNESALESVSSTADWTTVTNRSAYSLTDGDVMFTQFRVSGANTQAQLGMENSSGDFFGIYAVPNGSSHDLKTRVKVNGTTTDSMLMSASTFKRNTLYEAMIFVDANDGFHLRVWKKGDPTNYVESSSSSPNGAAAWRFTDKVYNGTVFLDSYFEGVPYSETETAYNASTLYNTLSDKIPNLSSLTNFVDLQVNWSPVSSVISRLFDGDYSWSGTKTTYDYNTADQGSAQYGNLTRTTQSYWNGSAWVDYRAKLTQFYPNATSALTTLPAREVSLDCASGCDFTTATGKLAETLYLYDNASAATTSPSVGKLAATRTWVDRQ
jgi:hypothetical protein